MRRIANLLLIITVVVGLCSALSAEEKSSSAGDSGKAVKLFNGENLAGWDCFTVDPEVKMQDVWSVQDGVLVCKGEPLGYLVTKKEYENFKLVVEWRWAPGKKPGNSGVLLRISGDAVGFLPKCVEAQLMHRSAGDIWGFHGFKLKGPEDRFRKIENHAQLGTFVGVGKIKDAEKKPGEWNKYEITLNGGALSLVVNGEEVNQATDCDVVAGKIGLQSEGGEIHFRTVKLIPIEENKGKEIVLFNGTDLEGWSFRAPDSNARMEDTFSVKDGVLHCTGRPGGYLHTNKTFTNYVLNLEWRWPKGSNPGNNGVLVRVLEGEHFFGNVWPKCIEVQLLHRRAGDILTIGEFSLNGDPDRTRGRYTAMAKPSNEKPPGEWNHYEIIIKGGDLTLNVNGEVQNIATDVEEVPGTIGLQSEGSQIQFRNIKLIPLGE